MPNSSYPQIDLDDLEQLPESLWASMAQDDKALVLAAVAELRVSRKVVDAARAVQDDAWNDEEGYISPDHWNALSAALGELEALK